MDQEESYKLVDVDCMCVRVCVCVCVSLALLLDYSTMSKDAVLASEVLTLAMVRSAPFLVNEDFYFNI